MSEEAISAREAGGRIGKQVVLPWSKAVEIAAKSVRVRFWRSMITMSSIVLAIAFLMSIWTSTAIMASLSLGPGRDIEAVKAKLERARSALAATEAERLPTLEEFAEELEDARDDVESKLDDQWSELEDAKGEEKKKLKAEIGKLEAKVDMSANRLQFLLDDLNERSKEIDEKKAKRAKGFQKQLDAIEAKVAAARAASSEQPAKPLPEELAADLSAALAQLQKAIAEKEDAARKATDAVEKEKLDAELAELRKKQLPAQRAQLVVAFLTRRSADVQSKKSAADAELNEQIEALKPRIKRATSAIAAGEEERAPILTELEADLEVAVERTERAIQEKTAALAKAQADHKILELKEAIGRLQARLDESANRLMLLVDYLTARREELQRRKGKLDAILQQERTGESEDEEEAAAKEAPPTPAVASARPEVAEAAAGGFVTDFLSQMTPTDKWLAILALLVCFVGIVNAMFMTVQERFREIGTMKCLGALDAFIVKIFLVESAALGLLGTLLGIVVGMLLSSLRQLWVYGWPTFIYFPLGNILLAAVMAAFIGLILSVLAAIFPARRAARMEPVEAMRVQE